MLFENQQLWDDLLRDTEQALYPNQSRLWMLAVSVIFVGFHSAILRLSGLQAHVLEPLREVGTGGTIQIELAEIAWKRKDLMKSEYTAVIKQTGGWWVGWIEEIPGVNCQERSRDELVKSLREALKEMLEFNRNDAVTAAGGEFLEEKIAI